MDIENVLHGVLSGYSNLGRSREHDISMLVLELQELMTYDEHHSKVVTGPVVSSVLAPTKTALQRDPLNRLESKCEIASSSVKKLKST